MGRRVMLSKNQAAPIQRRRPDFGARLATPQTLLRLAAVTFLTVAPLLLLHACTATSLLETVRVHVAATTEGVPSGDSSSGGSNAQRVSTPIFAPTAGTYSSDQQVAIADSTSGATIYYTTDGSTPTTSSTAYTGPVPVAGDGTTLTINAFAVVSGMTDSEVATATFTIDYSKVSTPQFDLTPGIYVGDKDVTITDSTPGATIFYTTDGSIPTSSSLQYTAPVAIVGDQDSGTRTTTISAIAVKAGMIESTVASTAYTITYDQLPPPEISPLSGTYSGTLTVTIFTVPNDCAIRYTVDGTNPTRTDGTVYSGPISVSTSQTLKATAAKPGWKTSTMTQNTYTMVPSGSLDVSFGSGGKVTTSFGVGTDYGLGVAIQSDQKIVVAGLSDNGTNDDFAIARYNPSGELDIAFGSGGRVTTPFYSGDDKAEAVAIQSDGKIVVGGYSNTGSSYDFALARYTASGNLDSSFGSGGKVTTPIGSNSDYGHALAIHGDGQIVLAGDTFIDTNYHIGVAEYYESGSRDYYFGYSGKVTTTIGSSNDGANGIATQEDGKTIVVGYSNDGSNSDIALVRYTTSGFPDSSFGSAGIVTTPIGSYGDSAQAVAIQNDGKVVVAGYTYNGSNYRFAVVRYTTNGGLDTSFGSGGIVTTAVTLGDDFADAIAIQSDGKIVVAGYSEYGTNDKDFAVVRYNGNGTLDSTFGSDGKVTTQIGAYNDVAKSMAIQSDGKIVVAGYADTGSSYDFAVVRYWP